MIRSLDLLLLLSSTSIVMFFHQHIFITIIISILLLVRVAMAFYIKETLLKKSYIILSTTGIISLFTTNNHLYILRLACFLAIYYTILLLYDLIKTSYKDGSFFRQLFQFKLNFFIGISIVISLVLVFFTILPRQLSYIGPPLLKGSIEGSRESYISQNNHLIHKNINYPSPYENSRLDVYQTKNPKGTLFFIHGGGYVVYDKSHRIDYLMRFVDAGYNVVNINYSLFPNNAYPDTTKQVLDAYTFIINNAEVFNIDTNKIFLSGDSAGGQLAGQLALLLTNEEYRKNMNISIGDTTLEATPLAFMGIATMFDITTANQTDSPPINWLFDTVLRDYFKTDNLKLSNEAKEASIIQHVNQNFPTTFISDGNLATFDKQAREFHNKLVSYNIESNLYLIETNNILQHGFELDVDNPYAQDVFEKQIEFMDKQIKKN